MPRKTKTTKTKAVKAEPEPVAEPVPVPEQVKVVAPETAVADKLVESTSEFLAKLHAVSSQMSSLKSEFRTHWRDNGPVN